MSDETGRYDTTVSFDDEEIEIRIEFTYDPGRPARLYPPPGDPEEGAEVTGYDVLVEDPSAPSGWRQADAALEARVVEALGGDYALCGRLVDTLSEWC